MEYFNLKDAIVEVQEMLMFQIESKGLQFDVNIFDSVQYIILLYIYIIKVYIIINMYVYINLFTYIYI